MKQSRCEERKSLNLLGKIGRKRFMVSIINGWNSNNNSRFQRVLLPFFALEKDDRVESEAGGYNRHGG